MTLIPAALIDAEWIHYADGADETMHTVMTKESRERIFFTIPSNLAEAICREHNACIGFNWNGFPLYGEADEPEDKPFRFAAEMADFEMIIGHCTEAYGWMSGYQVSKPNTLPTAVIAIAEDRRTEEDDELVEEVTAPLHREIGSLRAWSALATVAALCMMILAVAS